MNSRKNIQDELKGLNSDLPSDNQTPFSVPEGYFEGLAASVLAKIRAADATPSAQEEIHSLSPLLAGISRKMPNSIPDQYFDTTIELLPALVSEEKESPVLYLIGKEMPYEVPAGYFVDLPENIIAKIREPKGKVVPLFQRKWMRMTVAAAIAGIICISGLLYLSDRNNNGDFGNVVAQQLKKIPTKELDAFIKSADVDFIHSTTSKHTSAKSDIKNLLKDVSDKELDAFLKQVPSDDELTIN